MVSDVTTELPAEVEDEVGFDADITVEPTEPEAEEAPSEEAPDPVAELREQFKNVPTRDELQRVTSRYDSEIGRSQRLEKRLDSFVTADQFSAINPRIDSLETALQRLTDAIASSDMADDALKAQAQATRTALQESRTQREWDAREAALIQRMQPARPESAGEDQTPWLQATNDAIAELREDFPDFDPATIPSSVWQAGKQLGTPARAVMHVRRWVEQQQNAPTDRVAQRKRAAGNGAPNRNGSATDIEQLMTRAETAGIPMTDDAARRRLAAHLGLDL